MKFKTEKNILAVRLYGGEDFLHELERAFKCSGNRLGLLVSAAGMLKDIKLGYFMGGGEYKENIFSLPREIVSLSGNIINDGETCLSHLHLSVADDDGKVAGGHLHEATVHGTGEIFICLSDMQVSRELEENTKLRGLKL